MTYKVLQSYCMLLPLCQSKKPPLFHSFTVLLSIGLEFELQGRRVSGLQRTSLPSYEHFNEHFYVILPLRRREKREMTDAFHSSREGS
jgi:hypothetical protein